MAASDLGRKQQQMSLWVSFLRKEEGEVSVRMGQGTGCHVAGVGRTQSKSPLNPCQNPSISTVPGLSKCLFCFSSLLWRALFLPHFCPQLTKKQNSLVLFLPTLFSLRHNSLPSSRPLETLETRETVCFSTLPIFLNISYC